MILLFIVTIATFIILGLFFTPLFLLFPFKFQLYLALYGVSVVFGFIISGLFEIYNDIKKN